MAAAMPGTDFIGIEVHEPGVGALLKLIGERQLDNLRIVQHDAVEVLQQMVAPARWPACTCGFPTPGTRSAPQAAPRSSRPSCRTAGQRLACRRLPARATDWQPYAEQMLEVLSAEPGWQHGRAYAPRPAWRPLTKFERRGLRLGHGVWDLVFKRSS
jgi:tRNA (guanine-N7-)-methyltransferase